MSLRPLPWHGTAWYRFAAWRDALPHAVVLRGRPGLGKTHLARTIAAALLCESPAGGGFACGECGACNWFAQGNHPDFRMVEPEILSERPPPEEGGKASAEKLSKQIRIDQIRELQGFLSVGTHRGGLRVIIVRPAEAMNASTANALLKSLEEPPPGTLFLLVSSDFQRLLPTVRSRCQALEIGVPEAAAALEWLKGQGLADGGAALAYAGGAPLAAIEQAEAAPLRDRLLVLLAGSNPDPLTAADICQQVEPAIAVGWLQKWAYDLAATRVLGRPRYHPAHADVLRGLGAAMNPVRLLRFQRRLAEARAVAEHPLNARLYFEDLFLHYQSLKGGSHG